jgi:hypothetical protein
MATYPGGVYSPSAKSNGQVIQAAWFNDPDAEIAATQDALKNGIVHAVTISTGGLTVSTGGLRVGGPSTVQALNAGASTLASLSVSGGSTLGTLSAGASTVTDLTVTGTLTVGSFSAAALAVRLTHSANQAVANGTWTGLSWDTETQDSTALHSTAANSSRISLTSSGWWSVGSQAIWNTLAAAVSTMILGARIVRNDNEILAGNASFLDGTAPSTITALTPFLAVGAQTVVYATDTTSFVTAQVYHNSGSTGSVRGDTGGHFGPAQFWAVKMGG